MCSYTLSEGDAGELHSEAGVCPKCVLKNYYYPSVVYGQLLNSSDKSDVWPVYRGYTLYSGSNFSESQFQDVRFFKG